MESFVLFILLCSKFYEIVEKIKLFYITILVLFIGGIIYLPFVQSERYRYSLEFLLGLRWSSWDYVLPMDELLDLLLPRGGKGMQSCERAVMDPGERPKESPL